MNGTVDDQYLEWLYTQVWAARNRNPARSYWQLAKHLYTTPFLWFIPNDDNRVEDGKQLRIEFLDTDRSIFVESNWLELECSVLEMLVALARRASFEDDGTPSEWVRIFLENLGLDHCTDSRYNTTIRREVGATVERLIYRKYSSDGHGGLFPLADPRQDQRNVELWYQLSAYLLEGG